MEWSTQSLYLNATDTLCVNIKYAISKVKLRTAEGWCNVVLGWNTCSQVPETGWHYVRQMRQFSKQVGTVTHIEVKSLSTFLILWSKCLSLQCKMHTLLELFYLFFSQKIICLHFLWTFSTFTEQLFMFLFGTECAAFPFPFACIEIKGKGHELLWVI